MASPFRLVPASRYAQPMTVDRRDACRRFPAPSRLDKLGVLIALIAAAGAIFQPFALFRANRIVAGEGREIIAALPPAEAWLLAVVLAGGIMVALLRTPAIVRLLTGLVVARCPCDRDRPRRDLPHARGQHVCARLAGRRRSGSPALPSRCSSPMR